MIWDHFICCRGNFCNDDDFLLLLPYIFEEMWVIKKFVKIRKRKNWYKSKFIVLREWKLQCVCMCVWGDPTTCSDMQRNFFTPTNLNLHFSYIFTSEKLLKHKIYFFLSFLTQMWDSHSHVIFRSPWDSIHHQTILSYHFHTKNPGALPFIYAVTADDALFTHIKHPREKSLFYVCWKKKVT